MNVRRKKPWAEKWQHYWWHDSTADDSREMTALLMTWQHCRWHDRTADDSREMTALLMTWQHCWWHDSTADDSRAMTALLMTKEKWQHCWWQKRNDSTADDRTVNWTFTVTKTTAELVWLFTITKWHWQDDITSGQLTSDNQVARRNVAKYKCVCNVACNYIIKHVIDK